MPRACCSCKSIGYRTLCFAFFKTLAESSHTWRYDGGGGVVGRHREVNDGLPLGVDVDAGGADVGLLPLEHPDAPRPVQWSHSLGLIPSGKTGKWEPSRKVTITFYTF